MADSQNRTSIKIPPDLDEKIRKQAEIENRSKHNMILTILKRYFDNQKPDSTPPA